MLQVLLLAIVACSLLLAVLVLLRTAMLLNKLVASQLVQEAEDKGR